MSDISMFYKKNQLTPFFFYSSVISPMLLKNKLCYDLRYFPEVTVANKDWNPVCQVPS